MPLLPPVMTAIFPANFLDDIVFSFFCWTTLSITVQQNRTLYRFHFYCFLSPSIAMVAIHLSSSGDAPALALTLMPVITDRRQRAATFESSQHRPPFSSLHSGVSFSRPDCKNHAPHPFATPTP